MTDPVDPRLLMTAAERALFAEEPNPVTALLKDAEHFAMSLAEGDFALVNVKGNVPPVQFRAFKRMVYQTTKARVLITNVPEGVDVAHLPADVLAAALDERGKDMIDRHKRAIQAASPYQQVQQQLDEAKMANDIRRDRGAVTPTDLMVDAVKATAYKALAEIPEGVINEPSIGYIGLPLCRSLHAVRPIDLHYAVEPAIDLHADLPLAEPNANGDQFPPMSLEYAKALADKWHNAPTDLAALGVPADFLKPTPYSSTSAALLDRVEYGPEPAGDDLDHGHVVKTGLQQMYESAVTPEAKAMVKSGRYMPREGIGSEYVEGRGTVRSCIDCGEEVDGGPTRCVPCADKLEAQDMPESVREARARTVEGVAEKVDALLERGSLARRVLGVKRLAPGETPRTPKDVTATAMVWNGQVEARAVGRWVMPPIYRFVAAHTRDADVELDEEQAAYDIASGFVQTEDKIVWQLAQAAVMASGDIQVQASNIRQLIQSLVSVMAKHRQIPATFAINRAQVVDLVKAKDEGWLEPVRDRELVLAGHIATMPELDNALICTTPGWNSKALTYAEETIPPGYVFASAPTHYAGQFSIQSTVSVAPYTAVVEGKLRRGLAGTQHIAAALTNPYAVAIGRLT